MLKHHCFGRLPSVLLYFASSLVQCVRIAQMGRRAQSLSEGERKQKEREKKRDARRRQRDEENRMLAHHPDQTKLLADPVEREMALLELQAGEMELLPPLTISKAPVFGAAVEDEVDVPGELSHNVCNTDVDVSIHKEQVPHSFNSQIGFKDVVIVESDGDISPLLLRFLCLTSRCRSICG